jgi:hypothetical protein
MINTVYNFNETTSFSNYTITDVFSKTITLVPENITVYNDWFTYINVDDGRTLVDIAYDVYNNSNLWDLIFIINNMDTVFDLPKHNDYVYSVVDNRFAVWTAMFPHLSQTELDNTKARFLEEEIANNEKHRKIILLKSQYLPRFTELLNV